MGGIISLNFTSRHWAPISVTQDAVNIVSELYVGRYLLYFQALL